jgi:hypothetical protein
VTFWWFFGEDETQLVSGSSCKHDALRVPVLDKSFQFGLFHDQFSPIKVRFWLLLFIYKSVQFIPRPVQSDSSGSGYFTAGSAGIWSLFALCWLLCFGLGLFYVSFWPIPMLLASY